MNAARKISVIEKNTRSDVDQLVYQYVTPDKQAQELWFSLERFPWRTLAIVPASAGVSVLDLASALHDVGDMRRDLHIHTLDAHNLGLPELAEARRRIDTWLQRDATRVIFNTASPVVTPAAVGLIRSADVAVLVVHLEKTASTDADHVLEAVGRDKFIGVVTVAPTRAPLP